VFTQLRLSPPSSILQTVKRQDGNLYAGHTPPLSRPNPVRLGEVFNLFIRFILLKAVDFRRLQTVDPPSVLFPWAFPSEAGHPACSRALLSPQQFLPLSSLLESCLKYATTSVGACGFSPLLVPTSTLSPHCFQLSGEYFSFSFFFLRVPTVS